MTTNFFWVFGLDSKKYRSILGKWIRYCAFFSNTESVLGHIKKKYNWKIKESEETVAERERECDNNAKNQNVQKLFLLTAKTQRGLI